MEYLINSFFNIIIIIKSFINMFKLIIESNKGIYSIYLYNFPLWTINIITNDYYIINSLINLLNIIIYSDIISILGSIDIILGSIDLILIFY